MVHGPPVATWVGLRLPLPLNLVVFRPGRVPITSHNAPDDPQHGIVATLGYVIVNVAQDQLSAPVPLLCRDSATPLVRCN